jgi:flagellar basal body-associated protein FliL
MNKQVLIGIIITVLLVVIGGTLLFMRNRSKQNSTSVPSSQVSPTEEPTPTCSN